MRMTVSPATAFDDSTTFRSSSPAERAGFAIPKLTIAEVAALSTERIHEMSRQDLVDLIRSMRNGHLRPGVLERLPQMDVETLRKLVFLTRRYCRNQQLSTDPECPPSLVAAYCG